MIGRCGARSSEPCAGPHGALPPLLASRCSDCPSGRQNLARGDQVAGPGSHLERPLFPQLIGWRACHTTYRVWVAAHGSMLDSACHCQRVVSPAPPLSGDIFRVPPPSFLPGRRMSNVQFFKQRRLMQNPVGPYPRAKTRGSGRAWTPARDRDAACSRSSRRVAAVIKAEPPASRGIARPHPENGLTPRIQQAKGLEERPGPQCKM